VSRPMEGFEHVGALGMGLDAFRLRSQGTIRLFPIAHPTAGPMSPGDRCSTIAQHGSKHWRPGDDTGLWPHHHAQSAG
jgi:hypothetical protein